MPCSAEYAGVALSGVANAAEIASHFVCEEHIGTSIQSRLGGSLQAAAELRKPRQIDHRRHGHQDVDVSTAAKPYLCRRWYSVQYNPVVFHVPPVFLSPVSIVDLLHVERILFGSVAKPVF